MILTLTSMSLFVNAHVARGRKILLMPSLSRGSLLVIPLCFGMLAAAASAQWHEPFESPTPTWRLAESDTAAQIITHKRTVDRARMGSMSEYLRLRTGVGSYTYLTHNVPAAVIIQELQPRVSVYAQRAGIQMLGIIVLPHAIDPETNRPISTLVHGTSYNRPGAWQELAITEIPQQLARQVRRLRNQKQIPIDTRGAHLSHIVLNAYTEPGVSEMWIDQLVIHGCVPSDSVTGISNDSRHEPPTPARQQPTLVQLEADTLRIRGKPFFPIMIEYQGEPFSWLKSMGINCVKLARSPSAAELQAAEANDLWIVAPPPHFDDRTVPVGYDRVLSWSLGNQLGMPELQDTADLAAETKRHDQHLRRPLICSCHSSLWRFSGVTDILLLEPLPLFSDVSLPRSAETLRSQMRHMRAGKPAWAYVATQPGAALVAQLRAIQPASHPQPVIDADQIRLATYYALASGCRGICFESRTRLDLNDAQSRVRSQTIRQITLELDTIRPWLAASKSQELLTPHHDHLHGRILKTKQAELVILLQTRPGEQFVLPPADRQGRPLKLPEIAAEAQVYRLTPTGLRTLARSESTVEVDQLDRVTLVLATQDPHVVHYVSDRLAAHAGTRMELQHGMLRDKLRRSLQHAHEVQPNQREENASHLVMAKSQLLRMGQALESRDLRGAADLGTRVDTALANLQFTTWHNAVTKFTSLTSSPACVTFDALPFHGQLQSRLQQANWSANLLPGVDVPDWETMQRRGWRMTAVQPGWEAAARVMPGKSRMGGRVLQVNAHPMADVKRDVPSGEPALRIDSPPLQLPIGSVVHMQGWVKTRPQGRGSQAPLIVYDSLAGPELAVHLDGANDWQPFSLYRIVSDARPLTLSCVLTEAGSMAIADCRISIAQPAEAAPVQTTNATPRLIR